MLSPANPVTRPPIRINKATPRPRKLLTATQATAYQVLMDFRSITSSAAMAEPDLTCSAPHPTPTAGHPAMTPILRFISLRYLLDLTAPVHAMARAV